MLTIPVEKKMPNLPQRTPFVAIRRDDQAKESANG